MYIPVGVWREREEGSLSKGGVFPKKPVKTLVFILYPSYCIS